MNDLIGLKLIVLAALATLGCAGETRGAPERGDARAATGSRSTETGMSGSNPDGGVAKLPFARGKTFRTLDEYLAHLERQGAIDLPYWRQVEPGLYERVTTRVPAGPPERATRAELMRRFGFTR